jgi:hypothetical protein
MRTLRLPAMLCAVVIGLLGAVGTAAAAPCDGNEWQPTFVHDLQNGDGPWFVTPQLSFIKLRGNDQRAWTVHACELISTYSVRDRRGFTTCQDYTRIQCGCSRYIPGNATCAGFLQTHPRRVP